MSGGGNHATLISGTVATIWGTRILTASDHCIEYGGRIGAEGEFVPALLDGSAAADGNQITLGPGKHSNPSSRLNWNPFQAAEFNGRHIPQDYAPGDSIASLPTNSVFRQTNASGDTKLLVFESELSVDDLSKTQQYTGNSTGYEDPNLVLLSRKASIVKDRNSNAITVRV
ncbi:MAG: hypothetical protein KatS3mg087_1384 [Patescibacteria group bacterium]|nr:MAG: hypothetical protein KatS3mg087_1384 [Patescibacteria group bacterium]